MQISRIRAFELVRQAVGPSLIAAPRLRTRTDDPSFALLVRTVGVRDVVLGVGSVRAVGVRRGLAAALVPVPFVAAGVWALRELGDRATGPHRVTGEDLR
ncbi:hypothetical protein [Nocardioides sp. W7]|uniref:hypothetical protein n=1 Tax=Nocardioides sp. W7 TaxID=2931390 RepID=UPI001FD0729C|nr:hypothetical protein [Nocardioides sp. W7]